MATVFVGMVKQEERSMAICTVPDRWRSWSDRGGMTIEDLEVLAKDKPAFCNTACVMSLIRESAPKRRALLP